MVDFAIDHYGELRDLTGGELNRYTLPRTSKELHFVQRGAESNDDMQYLENNFLDHDKSGIRNSISYQDISIKQDGVRDLNEFQRLEHIKENFFVLNTFNTADGAPHSNMLRLAPPVRGNAKDITPADIGSWKSNAGFLDRLGLQADSKVGDYYSKTRDAFDKRTFADQIFAPNSSR